jgi:hypothetical protein
MRLRYSAWKAQTLVLLISLLIMDCAVAVDSETASKSQGDRKDSTSFSAFVPTAQSKEDRHLFFPASSSHNACTCHVAALGREYSVTTGRFRELEFY